MKPNTFILYIVTACTLVAVGLVLGAGKSSEDTSLANKRRMR
ncbi:MAG: hypothetical protein ACR2H3_16820 [Acidimicrobiales bacterium]